MLPYRDSKIMRIALALFFILLLGYAIYEAQGLLFGPTIDVPHGSITVTDPFTTVKGRAERISELRLNGKAIPVTENGGFEEPFLLAPGSNRLVLEARDARGRTTRKVLDIIYNPAPGSTPSKSSTPAGTTTEPS
ncbi:MAG: hypothetical protein AAB908_01950 [Patescibacteria group bacterium]